MSLSGLGPCVDMESSCSAIKSEATSAHTLRVNMFDSSLAVYSPAHNRIEVVVREGRNDRCRVELASGSDKFSAGGLLIAKLIGCPTLQNHRPAIPTPGHSESGKGLAQDGLLECSCAPALAPVG